MCKRLLFVLISASMGFAHISDALNADVGNVEGEGVLYEPKKEFHAISVPPSSDCLLSHALKASWSDCFYHSYPIYNHFDRSPGFPEDEKEIHDAHTSDVLTAVDNKITADDDMGGRILQFTNRRRSCPRLCMYLQPECTR